MFPICFGIDPNPQEFSFSAFQQCVQMHKDVLKICGQKFPQKKFMIKLQLAFFLSHGSKGIELLEDFVQSFRSEQWTVILDGKFNEIENSLKAYLQFAFSTLKVHGLTINPFLGEKTIALAFEACGKHAGRQGRVYVLCATSEQSRQSLSYLQENPLPLIQTCARIGQEVFQNQEDCHRLAGLVIGANRTEVLFSAAVAQSKLSILSPGLGAQKASFDVLANSQNMPNEIIFPMSRGLFEGGNIQSEAALAHVFDVFNKI